MKQLRGRVVGILEDGQDGRCVQLKFDNCTSVLYDELRLKIEPTDQPRLGEVFYFEIHDIKDPEPKKRM